MNWTVTITYHCLIVDVRYFREERKARDFYAESLARYNQEYEVTLDKQ